MIILYWLVLAIFYPLWIITASLFTILTIMGSNLHLKGKRHSWKLGKVKILYNDLRLL